MEKGTRATRGAETLRVGHCARLGSGAGAESWSALMNFCYKIFLPISSLKKIITRCGKYYWWCARTAYIILTYITSIRASSIVRVAISC